MGNLENVATRVVMLICEGLLTGFILFLFANSFLQKAAESQALFKINADEKLEAGRKGAEISSGDDRGKSVSPDRTEEQSAEWHRVQSNRLRASEEIS